MNWTKAVIAGAVGGLVNSVYEFVMHGIIMRDTYMARPELFGSEEGGGPIWFTLVAVVVGIAGGLLFAKTRNSWAAGVKGGATFGFWLGLVAFFAQFYNPLVFPEFPYYLSWCWGGITLIGTVIFGAVAGAIYKEGSAA